MAGNYNSGALVLIPPDVKDGGAGVSLAVFCDLAGHEENRRRDAGATKIAAALDKRPQSKESGRSGFNRCFRIPIEEK